MNLPFVTRALASPDHPRRPLARRWLVSMAGIAAAGASLLSACASTDGGPIAGEPANGCLLAAINERAVIRARNYLRPDVEAHLLAIWFRDSRHVALVVKGDRNWFAWDDAYGGRPLFFDGRARQHLPDALSTARAAFPHQNVQLAWWAD